MEQISLNDTKNIFTKAIDYFNANFEDGINLLEVTRKEELAFKKYINSFTINIEKGKTRYNALCIKTRTEWFMLETIKKIMEINRLKETSTLQFCLDDFDKQSKMFLEYIKQERYKSYLVEDEYIK